MEKLEWHTEKRKVKDLILYEGNPRKLTEKEEADLTKSIKKFNLAEVPAINKNGKVIAGNMRVMVLLKQGRGEDIIDVRVPNRELTPEEEKEYLIRSNKNTGEWDFEKLANFDEEFLKDVGFEREELDEIFGLEMDEEFDVKKEFEKAIKNPKGVKEGDLWILGEHRLFVGNCVKIESWEKLLGKERFDLMETDPPYKIGYTKSIRKQKTKQGFKLQRTYTKIGETDAKGKPAPTKGFGYKGNRQYLGVEKQGGVPEYDEWLSLANKFQNPTGANVMIFENWKNTVELWQAIEKYWKIKNMIIWWIPNRHQGFSSRGRFFQKYDIAQLAGEGILNQEYEEELDDYLKEKGQKLLDTYEVILYGNNGKSYWDKPKGTKWFNVNDHITWTTETQKSSGQNIIFGTKPIQILVPYIKILSPRGGIVMEPFGGSGSTLIACEILKRKARCIEIEPLYAEVIITRWEKFTGKKAELGNKDKKI